MRDHARGMLWFAAAGVAVLAGVFREWGTGSGGGSE
jgi:hypothetical protein